MFKRVKYELSSMLGVVKVEIWVEEGKLHYSKETLTRPEEEVNNEISNVSAEAFSKKVEALRINNWKKEYQPQGYDVLDGVFWEVEYEEADGKKVKCSGENAFPSNWKAFKMLLSNVAGNVNID